MVVPAYNSSILRLRQECYKLKANLGYIALLRHKTKKEGKRKSTYIVL
jgi:hypothetical protein